ncbi:MAG: hypothetical protein JF625_02510, partial [Inquilinus limosus]|nr:hypothetical protein [Inquilinus limosus]
MAWITGTEQDDWLQGTTGSDVVVSLGGDDYAYGDAGNDILLGYDGDDWLFGGDGDDLIYGYTDPDLIEDHPLSGNDYLDGGAGYDKLYGGFGDDVYHLADAFLLGGGPWTPYYWAFDELTEKAGQGTDTVEVASDNGFKSGYILPENVENGRVLGDQAFTLWGNELANALTGGAGADRLLGETGNDRLDGGAGYDTLDGGAGNDLYTLLDANIIGTSPLRISFDAVTEAAAAGVDTVQISADSGLLSGYILTDNVENGIVIGIQAFRLSG